MRIPYLNMRLCQPKHYHAINDLLLYAGPRVGVLSIGLDVTAAEPDKYVDNPTVIRPSLVGHADELLIVAPIGACRNDALAQALWNIACLIAGLGPPTAAELTFVLDCTTSDASLDNSERIIQLSTENLKEPLRRLGHLKRLTIFAHANSPSAAAPPDWKRIEQLNDGWKDANLRALKKKLEVAKTVTEWG